MHVPADATGAPLRDPAAVTGLAARGERGSVTLWLLGLCVMLLFLGGPRLDLWRATGEVPLTLLAVLLPDHGPLPIRVTATAHPGSG